MSTAILPMEVETTCKLLKILISKMRFTKITGHT
jgi:hypothetical protein